jgi:hypothetical protein
MAELVKTARGGDAVSPPDETVEFHEEVLWAL